MLSKQQKIKAILDYMPRQTVYSLAKDWLSGYNKHAINDMYEDYIANPPR